MPRSTRVAHLALLFALAACNSVVLPNLGGSDDDGDGRTMPSPSAVPATPSPPAPAACTLPDRVTAEGVLVREGTDAGASSDGGVEGGAPADGGDLVDGGDVPPPSESEPNALDIEVSFSVVGGNSHAFGQKPTCVGCEVRRASFHPSGGIVTIRVPRTEGTTSAFSPAAIRVPFQCNGVRPTVTLKVTHKPNDSRVTVEGYATN